MLFFNEPGIADINEEDNNFFKLSAVCDQVAIDLDLPSSQYFNRFLSWASLGLLEIHFDACEEIKTTTLPVSAVLTAQCPIDMVDWISIGIQQNQYVTKMSVNDQLDPSPRTVATFNPTDAPPPGWLPNDTNIVGYGGFAFSNPGGRALFSGAGGLPQTGNFKVVNRPDGHKEILLDSGLCLPNSIIFLEYLATGINPSGETIISPYYYNYVRAYIHHQWAKFGKGAQKTESEIIRTGRELWHEEMKVRGRTSAIDIKSLLTVMRKNYRLTAHA